MAKNFGHKTDVHPTHFTHFRLRLGCRWQSVCICCSRLLLILCYFFLLFAPRDWRRRLIIINSSMSKFIKAAAAAPMASLLRLWRSQTRFSVKLTQSNVRRCCQKEEEEVAVLAYWKINFAPPVKRPDDWRWRCPDIETMPRSVSRDPSWICDCDCDSLTVSWLNQLYARLLNHLHCKWQRECSLIGCN